MVHVFMKKYELSVIGAFHTNHNEDASTIIEIGEDRLLIAVMDGYSMGKESHFASTLIAKLLRKIGKEISFRAFVEKTKRKLDEELQEIMKQLFQELMQLKHQLHLEKTELLSTLMIGVLDKGSKDIEFLTVGDGLICYDGKRIEYEQDDKPDYLGYHLGEEFDTWYENQFQRLSLKNVTDWSIATDGIFTFKNFDGQRYEPISETEIVEYFLIDENWMLQETMLKKKLLHIENTYGLQPSDDLTIIRIKMA